MGDRPKEEISEGVFVDVDPESVIKSQAAEITRLRAALADAQAVGFAAGVEAAAKAGANASQQLALRRNPDLSPLRQQLIKQAIANPIRALTPPEATAAAARVLLGDDIQIARMAEAIHNGPLGADDHWFSAATKQGAWCVDVVRAALRAIAGDTP